jgi:putative ABC transport system permease protein
MIASLHPASPDLCGAFRCAQHTLYPHPTMVSKLFRKTPIAWFQLTREKTRLLVALAGIAFADILIFVQLGFKDALFDSAAMPYQVLQGDLFLVNPQFETLFSTKSFSRERVLQAKAIAGVDSISWLYISIAQWRNPVNRTTRSILVFGTDPATTAFKLPEVRQNVDTLKQLNTVLFDKAGRPEFGDIAALFQQSPGVETELNNNLVRVSGVFTLGASFSADGNVIASDSTFLRVFPSRKPDDIEVGIISLQPGADVKQVQADLKADLPNDVLVLTLAEFADREKQYWANATPIGFIFILGSIVGFIVGIVIVYQILYSDVSDHLPEYATLKAMGYSDRYLVTVLIQESLILAILGFLPGALLSVGLYSLAQGATLLPIAMTGSRATTVFVLTIVMCVGSGLIAMRKLQAADPADIF